MGVVLGAEGATSWPLSDERWAPLALLLYGALGVSAWLVWRRVDVGVERKRAALRVWGWVLLLSGLWPAALFGAAAPETALMIMVMLLGAMALTARAFFQLQRGAALLLLPYAAWLCWATYMNACCF